jgi:hypothetical protein
VWDQVPVTILSDDGLGLMDSAAGNRTVFLTDVL